MIVDDHRCFGDLLGVALATGGEYDVAGRATTEDDGVALVERVRPDIALVDLDLGDGSGLTLTRRLREREGDPGRGVVVVLVTAHENIRWLDQVERAGANGFVPKSGALTELLAVLASARTGSMTVAPSLRRQPAPVTGTLTGQEETVLLLLGRGLPTREIAADLHISVNTCRGYLKAIYQKLGARSQVDALVIAARRGLIEV